MTIIYSDVDPRHFLVLRGRAEVDISISWPFHDILQVVDQITVLKRKMGKVGDTDGMFSQKVEL